MDEYREGLIERWSGKLLRVLMAYLFVIGVAMVVYGLYLSTTASFEQPQVLIWPILMTVPYLLIRYRDPESSTFPLYNRASAYLTP